MTEAAGSQCQEEKNNERKPKLTNSIVSNLNVELCLTNKAVGC